MQTVEDIEYYDEIYSVTPKNDRWRRFRGHGCVCGKYPSRYTCPRCRYACCEKAVTKFCVCTYAYICPDHHGGQQQCCGSHS